ncbi:MAG: YjgP/YjgQ family permease [Pedosphaera sp.]|nr:YjgP/YjgQ family permease [Pedosphaera sp.]MSU44183.1 YjgP/YjgQ family permease [Pedosphaera sp.]
MKTLHWYLLRQVGGALIISVAVFTLILLLANAMKDVLGLLLRGQVPASVVLEAFALLLPYVVTFSLPMGLLTAVLLVFGRLSADQELTAARAGGASLIWLVLPLLALSIVLSGLALWVNLDIAPRWKRQSRELIHRVLAENLRQQPGRLLEAKKFITEIPGYIIRIEEQRAGGGPDELQLEGVLINEFQEGRLVRRTQAKSGHVRVDAQARKYRFNLRDVQIFSRDLPQAGSAPREGEIVEEGGTRWYAISIGEAQNDLAFPGGELTQRRVKINELTWRQLLAQSHERGRVAAVMRDFGTAVLHYPHGARGEPPAFPAEETRLQVYRENQWVGELRATPQSSGTYLMVEITRGELREGDGVRDVGKQVHLHGQVAFSFACVGFLLVGIPLGVRTQRRETSVGVAIALLLLLVYYSFSLLGRALSDRPDLYPQLIVWAPAILFQIIGMVLMWRANRGT